MTAKQYTPEELKKIVREMATYTWSFQEDNGDSLTVTMPSPALLRAIAGR
ncbi:hypothetical protein FACS18949_09480 [Clostridia bacterium]|nr:hypothetical protein FACS18949_09480 [Clostridia bacterium]